MHVISHLIYKHVLRRLPPFQVVFNLLAEFPLSRRCRQCNVHCSVIWYHSVSLCLRSMEKWDFAIHQCMHGTAQGKLAPE
jgi:hypothetical protein